MGPFKLSRSDTSLVGAKTLNSLKLFMLGEEAGRCDIVVELPVNEGSCSNGNEADEKEDTNSD